MFRQDIRFRQFQPTYDAQLGLVSPYLSCMADISNKLEHTESIYVHT